MSLTRALTLVFAVSVGYCLSLTSTFAQTKNAGATPPDNRDPTLTQLLMEVHELRVAVQRATVSNNRFQMLIERVRVQQAHVDALSRQLENVHSQVADMKAAKPQLEQQIKDTQDLLDRTPDPNVRAELESLIKARNGNLARIAPEEERLRSRESTLDNELQAAQSKLNELNSQLDILMSEMKAP